MAIRPNISVRGWPTDAGSTALKNYTAPLDATVVRRLRETGAHLIGATAMSEFGFGSSGDGAGEALRPPAHAELALDFMGECRTAAARASVCGLKPSYGLVSRFGLVSLIPSMECCGVLSGSLDTIRMILETVAGPDELDFSLPIEEAPDLSPRQIRPEQTTIGIISQARDRLTDDAAEGFEAGVDELRRNGFLLREMSLPDYPLFPLVHRIVGSVEASSATGRYDSVRYGPRAPGAKNWNEMYLLSRGAAFGTPVKSYLIQGAFLQFERYDAFVDACRIRARLVDDMRRLTSQVDFLVLPPCAGTGPDRGLPRKAEPPSGTPPTLKDIYEGFAATLFANVTGQPALYLPPASRAPGLGFQLSGPRLSDGRLLSLGRLVLDTRGGE